VELRAGGGEGAYCGEEVVVAAFLGGDEVGLLHFLLLSVN